MASPGGSDGAPTGKDLPLPSGSRSSSSSSSSQRITMGSTSKNEATPLKENNIEKVMEPRSFPFQVLQEITDNFAAERAIGQGAHAKLYRAKHKSGEEIAVKLFNNNTEEFDGAHFGNEFDNLMMFNHPNIVQLVGYSYETQLRPMEYEGKRFFAEERYRALCFEYMPMGSLQRHLSDESCGLDWQTRYSIIKGTCEGLKYLHEGLKEPLYHLNLKPDHILLDENMIAKLTGFGLAKIFDYEQTRVTQSSLENLGYMPPEYLLQGLVSKEFDIFSLGVIMTNIIAGPKARVTSVEMPYREFLDQVHENWRNRLEPTCTSSQTLDAYCEQVSICTKMGLCCVEEDRHKRPSIVEIIGKLDAIESMIEKARRP